jgi:hypothetical protein
VQSDVQVTCVIGAGGRQGCLRGPHGAGRAPSTPCLGVGWGVGSCEGGVRHKRGGWVGGWVCSWEQVTCEKPVEDRRGECASQQSQHTLRCHKH